MKDRKLSLAHSPDSVSHSTSSFSIVLCFLHVQHVRVRQLIASFHILSSFQRLLFALFSFFRLLLSPSLDLFTESAVQSRVPQACREAQHGVNYPPTYTPCSPSTTLTHHPSLVHHKPSGAPVNHRKCLPAQNKKSFFAASSSPSLLAPSRRALSLLGYWVSGRGLTRH